MSTTKRAHYLFRVSEGQSDVWEGDRKDTLRIDSEKCIVAEHTSECEGFDPPLDNGGFIFDLRDGTSMIEAKKIADFLNQHLNTIGTVTFGDAEDLAVEVENSKRNLESIQGGLTEAVAVLKANLADGNTGAAVESLRAVEGWGLRLADDWRRTIERFN